MTIALHNVTVLDFSQGLSGPFCSLLLGDLGARVLKVEPLEGDWARQLEPRQGNYSAVFLALNRNKLSIALHSQAPAGQEIAQRVWTVRGRVATGSAVRRQDDSDCGPV